MKTPISPSAHPQKRATQRMLAVPKVQTGRGGQRLAKELSQINFSKFTLLLYDIYARGLMVCMGRPNRLGERQISRAHRYPPFLKLCPLGREHDGPLCQMQRSSLHYGTNTRRCAL